MQNITGTNNLKNVRIVLEGEKMRIKFTKEMKEKVWVGITIATFTLLLFFLLTNFEVVAKAWSGFLSILFPFIIGFSLAFLLNPIMMFFERRVFAKWQPKGKAKRLVSLFIALFIALGVISLLVLLIVPAVVDSIGDLVSNNEVYIKRFSVFITDIFKDFNLDMTQINDVVGKGSEFLNNFGDLLSSAFPAIISTSYGILKTFLNILIGIAAGMYLLLDKEIFISNVRKVNFAIFPEQIAQYLKRMTNVCRRVFYDFIIGKAIDSLIIGIICYVGLSLLGIEYAALLSVIVGITNMIPVFGPFIGAVPGIIILLIIQPIQSVYFAIFILCLQQFDGNVLGPLILGDKLGLPSFWILFSVTIGGSFFGIVGMFVGVPVFAVLYYGIQEFINFRLESKQIQVPEGEDPFE